MIPFAQATHRGLGGGIRLGLRWPPV